MVLPISMSVHEIQCMVYWYGVAHSHFCMVNSVIKKSGHHHIFDLGGFETGPYRRCDIYPTIQTVLQSTCTMSQICNIAATVRRQGHPDIACTLMPLLSAALPLLAFYAPAPPTRPLLFSTSSSSYLQTRSYCLLSTTPSIAGFWFSRSDTPCSLCISLLRSWKPTTNFVHNMVREASLCTCVCVCVCLGGWVGGWVCMCVFSMALSLSCLVLAVVCVHLCCGPPKLHATPMLPSSCCCASCWVDRTIVQIANGPRVTRRLSHGGRCVLLLLGVRRTAASMVGHVRKVCRNGCKRKPSSQLHATLLHKIVGRWVGSSSYP